MVKQFDVQFEVKTNAKNLKKILSYLITAQIPTKAFSINYIGFLIKIHATIASKNGKKAANIFR
jgi:hypothetical protein